MFVVHLDSRGLRLHSRIPYPLNVLGSKYEYVLMKILGYLTDKEWVYRFQIGRSIVNWLADHVVLPIIHGEVITSQEVEHMVSRLEREGKAYVDKERCHGCGQCFLYCPEGAAKALRREHHHMTYCAPDLLGYA